MQEDLKQREIDIIRLMQLELTNRQIAERLGLSIETIRWYAKKIYAKLNVSGREQAVVQAEKLGILADESQDDDPKTQHNLPVNLTTFVGRELHQRRIIDLLKTQRLVSLTGTGGTGKTRLAIEVARSLLDEFSDGVYFIDLVSVTDPLDIPRTIANVLDIHIHDDEPEIRTLGEAINTRRLLLLMDNFEHLIEGAMIVHQLLVQTHTLKVLTTTRETLKLVGEQEYPVPPLTILNGTDVKTSEALTLFMDRAQLVKPSFRLTDENLDDILLICDKLDGLPLAIELVAAHVKVLTPQAILNRMDERITAFSSQLHNMPERHRTLSQTIDWSYQLLSDDEKRLFIQLSIFKDGASLDAIEFIRDEHVADIIFDLLLSLVDKNMIRQQEDKLGQPRFHMLETLNAYARDVVRQAGELSTLRHQHASYFMQLAQETAPKLMGEHQAEWFTRLSIEQNNIRQMLIWALSGEAVEMGIQTVSALRNYWWFQGLHGEGWHWFDIGQKWLDEVSPSIRADFLLAGAFIAYFRQLTDIALEWGQDAMSLYETLGDQHGMAWCTLLPPLGRVESTDQTIASYQNSLAMLEAVDDPFGLSLKHNSFALLYMDLHEYDKAEQHFMESHRIAGTCGNYRQQNSVMSNLGDLAFRQGRYTLAQERIRLAMIQARNIDFGFELQYMLWTCVWLSTAIEELETAITLYGAAKAREHYSGQRVYPNQIQYVDRYSSYLNELREGDATFQQAYERGYSMSLDKAIDYAIEKLK